MITNEASAMDMLVLLSTIIVSAITLLFLYMKWQFKYWKRRGIPGPEPELIYGNWKDSFKMKLSEPEVLRRITQEYNNEQYVGCYQLWKPVIVIRDFELIKKILEKDSGNFDQRPAMIGKTTADAPLDSLFTMSGSRWKSRRTYFSKIFTPAKMKDAIQHMQGSFDALNKDLVENMDKENHIDLIPVIRRFTAHAGCASFVSLDLTKHSKYLPVLFDVMTSFLHSPARTVIKFLGYSTQPKLYSTLRISTLPKRLFDIGKQFADDLFDIRIKERTTRNDLATFLLKLMAEGTNEIEKISSEEAIGHLFTFMQAATNSTSTTLSYVIYRLAQNQEVQEKLRDEVESVMGDEKVVTYDHLKEMTYLDDVITETLRLHPIVGTLKRLCLNDYEVDERLTISKGMRVYIDVADLHHNPELFPEPEVFKPERWSTGEAEPTAFLGFGRGPRMCLGKRFAELEVKAAISNLVRQYNILPSEKMALPLKIDPQTVLLTAIPIKGIQVKLVPRTS